ncbi:MAG: AtpZ/AtpI family protein [Sphingomicrobium sp.]
MATEEDEEAQRLTPDARLDSLEARLERAQAAEAKRTGVAPVDPTQRIGQQVIGHLIGGPIGGGLLGWGLDYLLGTRPWLLLTMLFVGFGVGLWNVVRISKTSSADGPGRKS